MDFYKDRLKRLFGECDCDVVILPKGQHQASNFLYMTGLEGDLFEGSVALLTKNRIVLLANALEDARAMGRVSKSIEVRRYSSGTEARKMIRALTKGKRVGFDGSSLTFDRYEHFREVAAARSMVNVQKAFDAARSVKDPLEIANISRAVRIVKRAFSSIQSQFRAGITETELAEKFDALVRNQGSEPSFRTIVCFGSNSAIPHHISDGTVLKPNSFVLIDAGARYNGYCSDITRTFIFRPDRASAKYRRMKDMYDTVREAQRLALSAARAGAVGADVHRAAETHIDGHANGEYAGRFIHGLGHSLGIDVHDSDDWALAPRCRMRIRKGMVFSDEPGIYVEGFGGVRIEDDILIGEKSSRML